MSSSSDEDRAGDSNVTTRERRKLIATDKKSTAATSAPLPAPALAPASAHIQLAPFWPEKPAIWFAQAEGQFAVNRITDDSTKFYLIFASLDRKYAAEVEDILTGTPDYQRLKSELIKRLSVSRENKVKQLLMHEQLGTRKPSQFLRHLQHLAGPDIPSDFLKTIWTSRLPTSLQPIVASQTLLPLDDLAELADRVNDIATPAQHAVAATSSSTSPLEELTRQVAELTKQVSALTMAAKHRPRSRDRRQQRPRGRSPSTRSQSSYKRHPICWYHSKHGNQALKCVKPCDFKPTGNRPGSQ